MQCAHVARKQRVDQGLKPLARQVPSRSEVVEGVFTAHSQAEVVILEQPLQRRAEQQQALTVLPWHEGVERILPCGQIEALVCLPVELEKQSLSARLVRKRQV